MLPALSREAIRNKLIPDAVVPHVLDPAMFRFPHAHLALPFIPLLEVTQSPYNGLVTTTLVALSDSPGLLPPSQIPTLLLIPTFKRSAATKLEDVIPMIPQTLTEVTLVPQTDRLEPALTPLPSLLT